MILHIPHASTVIPKEYRSLINLTDEELAAEHRYMCDMYTDELFDYRCEKVIAPVSRLICDMERFENDDDEEMAKIGMGVCYTHDHNLQQFKTVTPEHRAEIIKKYYKPHHKKLERLVDEETKKYGCSIIIDCHSFSSTVLPYEKDDTRPDICIGYNSSETGDGRGPYVKYVIDYFKKKFNVAENKPFSGALLPVKYINNKTDTPVISIMIEINRSLYMNERTGKKTEGFKILKKMLFELFKYIDEQQKTSCFIIFKKPMEEIIDNAAKIGSIVVSKKPLNKIKRSFVIETAIDFSFVIWCSDKEMMIEHLKNFETINYLLLEACKRKEVKESELYEYFKKEYYTRKDLSEEECFRNFNIILDILKNKNIIDRLSETINDIDYKEN